jgi:hypothetical protein
MQINTKSLVLSPGFEPDLLGPQPSVLTANTNSAWRNDWESNPMIRGFFPYRCFSVFIVRVDIFGLGFRMYRD